MQLHQDTSPDNQIRSYQPGLIKVKQDSYQRSIIITANDIHSPWEPQRLAELTAEHLQMLCQFEPQLILLGTGAKLEFPQANLYSQFIERGIGFEIMDTNTACGTFNLLVAEGRKVAAALLIY